MIHYDPADTYTAYHVLASSPDGMDTVSIRSETTKAEVFRKSLEPGPYSLRDFLKDHGWEFSSVIGQFSEPSTFRIRVARVPDVPMTATQWAERTLDR